MIPLYADYAPETQRKDKFGLDLKVTRAQLSDMANTPFFAMYTGKYGKVIAPVYLLSKVLTSLLPELEAYKLARKVKNSIFLKGASPALLKEEDHFLVKVHLANNVTLETLLKNIFQLPEATFSADSLGEEKINIKLEKVINNALAQSGSQFLTFNKQDIVNIIKDPKGKLAFSCTQELQIFKNDSGYVEVIWTFRIEAQEAEKLTQMQFLTIRNIDIYPLIGAWIAENYAKGPLSSLSLSRIAHNIDKTSVQYAKINEHGLCIGPNGRIYYIPRELDKTREYEDGYIKYCTSTNPENRWFAASNDTANGLKLPSNLAILVDWTNAKFSYSITNGSLNVLDLSQARPLTPTHVRNYARRVTFTNKILGNLLIFGDYLGINSSNFKIKVDGFDYDLHTFFSRWEHEITATGNIPSLYDFLTDEEMEPMYPFFRALASAMEEKRDIFTVKYSVDTWMSNLALAKVLAIYGGANWVNTEEADKKSREAAINQAVTPDWEMEAVPFFNNAPGVMPHQKRVLNLLKDSPNFALLPVAAGGGKTPMLILDILNQYAKGVKGPYLVLCPSTLVSQYVQEVMFFTKGQMNTIPLTTAVIKREGIERLQKIFEAAPRNTIVVASYHALKYNAHTISYGIDPVNRFPVVEFLRQFQFGYAACDESHQLKNTSSIISKAVRTLLSEVNTIRLASGTLAFNRVTDLVGQSAIMDPSLFGTEEDFRARFGKFDDKRKFTGLKKGAESFVNNLIKEGMVIAGAKRKEWASLLPKPVNQYYPVQLSPEEQAVYQQVLAITVEDIAANPTVRASMEELQKLREDVANLEENAERIALLEERLSGRLGPYLQRLERLVLNPVGETGFISMLPPDFISTKAKTVVGLVEAHVKQGIPGKVIIFTENIASAEAIYNAFKISKVLGRKSGLLYKVSEKAKLLDKFNNDPDIVWMVGVETSINTGLNLQAASRIIRAEYPWQPGAVEQGNARILRPLLKSKDGRTEVYFDWVMCDGTIDTLKVARLMSKTVEIAKFEHPNDPVYQDLGTYTNPVTYEEVSSVPTIPIMLDNIKKGYRFIDPVDEETDLSEYYLVMKQLGDINNEEFAEYRKEHPEELNEDGTMKSIPVPVEDNPKDTKLLRYVPYVEGTNLYKEEQLGLQNLGEYLNLALPKLDDEEQDLSDKERKELDKQLDEKILETLNQLKGETVWTEYGESQLSAVSSSLTWVSIIPAGSGLRVRVPLSSVFLITKKNVEPSQLYSQIKKSIGIEQESIPEFVAPAGAKSVKRGIKVEEPEEQEKVIDPQLQIALRPIIINGIIGLRFKNLEGHDMAINVLQQYGFNAVPKHYRAQIKNKMMLTKWLEKMDALGFRFRKPYDYLGAWKEIAVSLNRHQKKYGVEDDSFVARTNLITKVVSQGQLQNIMRWDIRPTKLDSDALRVQPMFSNGVIFAVMPSDRLYPRGKEIRRARVAGMQWAPGPDCYERYFSNKQEVLDLLNQLEKVGMQITNLSALKENIRKARIATFDTIEDNAARKEREVNQTRKRLVNKPATKKAPALVKKMVKKPKVKETLVLNPYDRRRKLRMRDDQEITIQRSKGRQPKLDKPYFGREF